MIKLLSGSDMKVINPREYIVADSDKMSLQKIEQFESKLNNSNHKVNKISRSRHVGQSYLTSIFTTLIAILDSIPMMYRLKPELLIVNGPGNCIPCCLIVFILSRVLYIIPKCKIVFVESSKIHSFFLIDYIILILYIKVCRVKTLSLTGKILYYLRLADLFFVQWLELHEKYPKSVYLGRLV